MSNYQKTSSFESSALPAPPLLNVEPTAIQVHVDDDEIDRPAKKLAPLYGDDTTPARSSRLRNWVAAGGPSVLLMVIAELVAIAYFITLIVIDDQTLHGKYDDTFTPRSVMQYKVWGIAVQVLVVILVIAVAVAIVGDYNRGRRWTLYIACVVYLVPLASGNAFSVGETAARRTYEREFVAKFNAFYCDVRTVRVCLEGDTKLVLQLTRGNATAVQSRENATDVAVSVWSRCQSLLTRRIGETGNSVRTTTGTRHTKKGVIAINTDPLYDFLHDCNGSSAIDAWCGDAYHRSTPKTDAEQRALPSPFASNPQMFATYKREWTRRMTISNVLLSVTAGCLLLAGIGLQVADRLQLQA